MAKMREPLKGLPRFCCSCTKFYSFSSSSRVSSRLEDRAAQSANGLLSYRALSSDLLELNQRSSYSTLQHSESQMLYRQRNDFASSQVEKPLVYSKVERREDDNREVSYALHPPGHAAEEWGRSTEECKPSKRLFAYRNNVSTNLKTLTEEDVAEKAKSGRRNIGNHISGKNGRIHRSLNINTETRRLSARRPNLQVSLLHSTSSERSLEESIQAAVEAKRYQQIPELLNASKDSCRNPNPFSFLSAFSQSQRVHVVDEILQSFILIRPRSRLRVAYSCLLTDTLESLNPLPLALAIIQCMLRSGCQPVPQTHLLLSKAWVEGRWGSRSVSSILEEMHSIGYSPDCGTCNYLIMSLCKVNQFEEAVTVLRKMGGACCIPDLDSYGTLISEMAELRRTGDIVKMVKEMVSRHGLNPRKETIVKAVNAMRANRDIWRAIDMIEFLESKNVHIGFETYELALEGCLEGRQFVLAGKFAIRMTGRGFIPYIRVRQRVVEGLVSIGESEFSSIVRQRFAELKS
ncbi:Pentatricopeptide repeat-containing protein [Sesamum alatum]|uniref:Pentatricopeptide repeat-containing protein n=1 Tax=Sesamum alatum TaxID=300844 RepID=A0AAE1XZI6_9LAMI|nr:Pentatricopeptide repeat-containing protein [Sesamum alatum]